MPRFMTRPRKSCHFIRFVPLQFQKSAKFQILVGPKIILGDVQRTGGYRLAQGGPRLWHQLVKRYVRGVETKGVLEGTARRGVHLLRKPVQ
jgi:hypothetical protein